MCLQRSERHSRNIRLDQGPLRPPARGCRPWQESGGGRVWAWGTQVLGLYAPASEHQNRWVVEDNG